MNKLIIKETTAFGKSAFYPSLKEVQSFHGPSFGSFQSYENI